MTKAVNGRISNLNQIFWNTWKLFIKQLIDRRELIENNLVDKYFLREWMVLYLALNYELDLI